MAKSTKTILPKGAAGETTTGPSPNLPQKEAPGASAKKAASDDIGPTDESKGFSAVVYLLGILISIIIYLLKKDDRYVKYHAAQAILFDLCVMVVSMVVGVGLFALMIVAGIMTAGIGFFLGFWAVWLAMMGLGLALFAIRVFFAYKAFRGERFRLPILGDQAEKMSES